MISPILFLPLIIAAVRAKSSASESTSPQPSGSSSCSSSNIPIDSCLTSTIWTLDNDSTKQLVENKEAAVGATINSLDVTGSATISFINNDAKFTWDDLAIALEVEVQGTVVDTTVTVNGYFDADLYMTGDSTFCMHLTHGEGQLDIEQFGTDLTTSLTPDGGFIEDDYVFNYTCTATSLVFQGTLNGQILVGPYFYTGQGSGETGPVSCNSKRSGTNTCSSTFNWDPLVQKACSMYSEASTTAPNTLGYFGQVLNIVCAASKSDDACCVDMTKYYNKPGCEGDWAGSFEQYVFNVSYKLTNPFNASFCSGHLLTSS